MPNPELTREERFAIIFSGNKYRFPVWRRVAQFAIDPPEHFYAKPLQEELKENNGLSPSGVSREIQLLQALGMITRIETPSYDRRVLYARNESPVWSLINLAFSSEVQK